MSNTFWITCVVSGTLLIALFMIRSALTLVASSPEGQFVFVIRFLGFCIVLARGDTATAETARAMLGKRRKHEAASEPEAEAQSPRAESVPADPDASKAQ